MRGTVVPTPGQGMGGRCASRSARTCQVCYSGDRFPITSCLCRSQLWCPLRDAQAVGAHPSGQVGAAHAARHDMPHREHHQIV